MSFVFNLKHLTGYEPTSLGEKIHLYRELRSLTQKEVGKRVGYSEITAETRMGRYENDKNKPKEETIDALAQALEINRDSLYETNLKSFNTMCHALFDIGALHGLRPILANDGNYYLEFGKPQYESIYQDGNYKLFLKQWYEASLRYELSVHDSDEERERKIREYALWRAEYPDNVNAHSESQYLNDLEKIELLDMIAEDIQTEKKKLEKSMKIDEMVKTVMPYVEPQYSPIKKLSDFIRILWEAQEGGLDVEMNAPFMYAPAGFFHLVSFRTEEIVLSSNHAALYAKILCGFITMNNMGIKIDSVYNRLHQNYYVSFLCHEDHKELFEDISEILYKMDNKIIAMKKEKWSESKRKEEFEKLISGKDRLLVGKNNN
ncbi:MAG: helix-turn-helix transcriptional regulator [Lachnospiraceae bacterium]|nr:helix-turn-helix transcriptional regulator [Lachnospiraceae bacterium]